MTKDDALELIERMPYIPAFVISNERNRLSALRAAQKSDDPVEWIKVVKTIYICRNDPKTGLSGNRRARKQDCRSRMGGPYE